MTDRFCTAEYERLFMEEGIETPRANALPARARLPFRLPPSAFTIHNSAFTIPHSLF
jgi:hypothetical protein